jgi:hypothetical protein
MDSETRTPANADEIRRIAGDLDDSVIRAIQRTKASASEVLDAVRWLRGIETSQGPRGIVRAVYEILQAEDPPDLR